MRTRLVAPSHPTLRVIALAGAVIATFAAGSAMAQPASKMGTPPPLARFFPRQDLVVYAEFDGLDAHRDAWKQTAAYRLLNETTTGAMLEQSFARLLDELILKNAGGLLRGRELVGLGEHLLRAGFAVGINRAGGVGPPRSFGLVIRGGAKGQTRALLDRLLRESEGPRLKIKRVQKPGGRTVEVVSDAPRTSLAWWAEGDDLAVSIISPSGVDAMIASLEGHEPSAVEHPTRKELAKGDDAPGLEPVGLAFFEMTALPRLPREALALGLDRVRRFDYRWGFRGRAIETILGAVVPAPRTGIPALFDQPTFDVRHLPPLPGGLDGFTVLSLDAARLYDQTSAALKAIDPDAVGFIAAFEEQAHQALGMKLRDDLLAPLGSRVTIYTFPTTVRAPGNFFSGLARTFLFTPKTAVILDVDDREATARALARLAEKGSQKVPIATPTPSEISVSLSVPSLQPLRGRDAGYLLRNPSPAISLPTGTHPAILVGRNELAFGATLSTARRARDHHERSAPGLPPGDPLTEALDGLPDRLMFLSVGDPRQSILPDLLVGVPDIVETLVSSQQRGPFNPLNFLFGVPFPSQALPLTPTPPPPVSTPDVPATPSGPGASAAPDQPGVVLLASAEQPAPAASPPGAGGQKPGEAPTTPPFDPESIPEADDLRRFLFPSASVLAVDDRGIRFITRESFPTINPATVVPVAIAMLVPATQSSRLAALRARSVNNLKQIGLAMHNHLSSNNHFPADIRGKDGKPLLSWRVRILPFIEQNPLFQEFKLDEPWDSPHNKALLERMLAVFAVPGSRAEPGMTFYRGLSGKSTLFDPAVPEGAEIASITDGTSNTIAVVEAKEAVPWTRPDSDIPFNAKPEDPESLRPMFEALGGHFRGGFNALFCDGSVRFLRDSINMLTLRALITHNGGEVVSSDSF